MTIIVYYINKQTIPIANEIKDLGVTVDLNLSFESHIDRICRNAYFMSNSIIKCFVTKSSTFKLRLFDIYVMPLITYCMPIWKPVKLLLTKKLEKIFKRFTKRILPLDIKYSDRLKTLNRIIIHDYSLYLDLILIHNILYIFDSPLRNIIISPQHHRSRRHRLNLIVPFSSSASRHSYVTVRSIKLWNSLPNHIKYQTTIETFKTSLLAHLLSL